MSARGSNRNFFQAHWDWLVALIGIIALGASFAFNFILAEELERNAFRPGNAAQVEPVKIDEYQAITDSFVSPAQLAAVDGEKASFLASGLRVFCSPGDKTVKGCGKPITFGVETCPFCGVSQKADERPTDDHDGDGLPDEYEKQHGLDLAVNDADFDKDDDGFTNLEEFQAGTDPSDPKSHPDYLDTLVLDQNVIQTYTTLMFVKTYKTPSGLKFEFKDPKYSQDYSRGIFSVYADQEIGPTGFIAKSYTEKTKKQVIGGGMEKTVDVSEATIVRKADGKTIRLVKDVRRTPTDFQATIIFNRIQSKGDQLFKVIDGQEFEIAGSKYKAEGIKKTSKGYSVKVTSLDSGKSRIIEALEQ